MASTFIIQPLISLSRDGKLLENLFSVEHCDMSHAMKNIVLNLMSHPHPQDTNSWYRHCHENCMRLFSPVKNMYVDQVLISSVYDSLYLTIVLHFYFSKI